MEGKTREVKQLMAKKSSASESGEEVESPSEGGSAGLCPDSGSLRGPCFGGFSWSSHCFYCLSPDHSIKSGSHTLGLNYGHNPQERMT